MTMNRRNVLIGLGATAAGGGAILGSGAFSQVEADRTVTVSTTGDASALLGLDLDTSYNGIADGGSGDAIQIDISQLNDNAITTFEDVLTVTNNGSQDVNLTVTNVPTALTFEDSGGTDIEGTPQTLTSGGGSIDITIEVDLVNESVPSDQDVKFDATAV